MPFSNGSFGGLYSAGMSAARILILAALVVAAVGPLSPSQAQQCVGGRQARQLIQQGQAVSLAVALQRAGISSDQLAGDPQLCQSGGGFAYRVQVVQNGQVSSVTIPAN